MIPKIRNIIIFVIIAAAFVLIYIYFIKSPSPEANLVSSPASTSLPDITSSLPSINTGDETAVVAKDFLTLLLSVKNIKLVDNIFTDPAFISLHDSSIVLIPDGTEGRPNPFAQFGNDIIPAPLNNSSTPPSTTPPSTTPPASTPPSTAVTPPSVKP